ncbi:MAG: hypothetical protein KGL63_03805, partial [Betaproteobacteria bacterium]|nr:hypothetical protein [Betaproteobacteria bacterium]
TLSQSGTFASKNVGTGIAVTASDTLSGTDAGNYTLAQPTGLSANITPKPVTVSATGINKTYDGTTSASVTLSSSGIVSGDSVTFTDTSANFSDKNVGTSKTVTVQGIAASGTDAGNYSLNNTNASTTASITAALSLTTSASAAGNAAATAISDILPGPTPFAGPALAPTVSPAAPAPSAPAAAPATAPSASSAAPDPASNAPMTAPAPASTQPSAPPPTDGGPTTPASVSVVLPNSSGSPLLSVVNNGISVEEMQP